MCDVLKMCDVAPVFAVTELLWRDIAFVVVVRRASSLLFAVRRGRGCGCGRGCGPVVVVVVVVVVVIVASSSSLLLSLL